MCFREISVKLEVRGYKILNVFLRVLNRFKFSVIVIYYFVEDIIMVTSVFVSSKGGIVEAEVSSILIYQFFVDKYYTHNKKISAISINRKNDF